MLLIRKRQRDQLFELRRLRLCDKCRLVVERRRPAVRDVERYADQVVDLSYEHDVYDDTLTMRLLLCRLEHGFALPLSPYRANLLGNEKFGARQRVERFIEAVVAGRDLQVVDLGDLVRSDS